MQSVYPIDLTDIVTAAQLSIEHAMAPHAPVDAQKNVPITKAAIESVLNGEITSHTHPETTPLPIITTWVPDLYLDRPPAGFAPCIADDKTDNSAAFLALANEATKRHCHLVLPYGKTQVNKFDLTGRKGVVLKGSGSKVCILKQTPKQESDLAFLSVIKDVNGKVIDWHADCCGLSDIGLEGNYGQIGMFSLLKIAGVNGCTKFENLYLYNGGHGITFDNQSYCWIYNIHNIWINQMRGRGINGVGTDNSLHTIDISGTQDDCVYASGANCRLFNFKIMGSKTKSGLRVKGSRLTIFGFDCQESFDDGVVFEDGYDCTITGLNCDNNGINYPLGSPWQVRTPRVSYGVNIKSGEHCTVTDYNFSNRNSTFLPGIAGVYISSSAQHYRVRMNDERNPYGISVNNSLTSIIERN